MIINMENIRFFVVAWLNEARSTGNSRRDSILMITVDAFSGLFLQLWNLCSVRSS